MRSNNNQKSGLSWTALLTYFIQSLFVVYLLFTTTILYVVVNHLSDETWQYIYRDLKGLDIPNLEFKVDDLIQWKEDIEIKKLNPSKTK